LIHKAKKPSINQLSYIQLDSYFRLSPKIEFALRGSFNNNTKAKGIVAVASIENSKGITKVKINNN